MNEIESIYRLSIDNRQHDIIYIIFKVLLRKEKYFKLFQSI